MKRLRVLMVLFAMVLATTAASWGGVFISVSFAPPVLPVYVQPVCPAPGYIWVPGYWAWDPDFGDYYWVPGTWVFPPQVGFLWTPGFWSFSSGAYFWHAGYWGQTVGFYGGINYGFGYPGNGYYGGEWHGRDFYYNRTVNNVNVNNVHNVYNQTVVNNTSVTRVAYNGGPGGVQEQPTSAQLAAQRGRHMDATSVQTQHEQAARSDRAQFASANQGRPAVVATPKAGVLNSSEAVRASLPASKRPANERVNANTRPSPRPPQNEQQVRPPQNTPQEQSAHNVPRPPNAQENVPQHARNAVPPQQQQQRPAGKPKNPPPVPETHAAARTPQPGLTQRPPSQPSRQAEPPRQTASHQSPPPKGHEEDRPR